MWSCSQESEKPGAPCPEEAPFLAHALYVQVSAWAPGPCCPLLQGWPEERPRSATLGFLPLSRISEVMGPGWRAGVCLLTSLVWESHAQGLPATSECGALEVLPGHPHPEGRPPRYHVSPGPHGHCRGFLHALSLAVEKQFEERKKLLIVHMTWHPCPR